MKINLKLLIFLMFFYLFAKAFVSFDFDQYKKDLEKNESIYKKITLILPICAGVGLIKSLCFDLSRYAFKKISLKAFLLNIGATALVVGCSYGYKEYLELQHKDISYPYHKFIFDAWCNYCGIVYKTDTQQVAYFKAYNFLKKLGFSKDKDRNKELIQVLEKIMAHINHIKNPNDNYCGLSLHNKSKEITEILSVELGLRITSFRFISKFFFNKYDFLESYYEQSIKLTELYEYLEKKENEYRFLCNLNNYLNIVQYKDGGLVKKVEKTIINKPCWSEINKNLPFFLKDVVIPEGEVGVFCKHFLTNLCFDIKEDIFIFFVEEYLRYFSEKKLTENELRSILGVFLYSYIYLDTDYVENVEFKNSEQCKKFFDILNQNFTDIGVQDILSKNIIKNSLNTPFSITVYQFLFLAYLKSCVLYDDYYMCKLTIILNKFNIREYYHNEFVKYLKNIEEEIAEIKKYLCSQNIRRTNQ